MKTFEKFEEKDKCWWCGSSNLSGEHKFKKTDLELLYGKVYHSDKIISRIKHRTENKGKHLQSSSSNIAKFEKNLCVNCNGSKSQRFDKAYEALIEYYYGHKEDLLANERLPLRSVFGENWQSEILNVFRYIAKHIGCRMVEFGFKPSDRLIDFLNGKNYCEDLKVVFQIKPYLFGDQDDPIECIFLGPFNPINCSPVKEKGVVTSFSGWYTIVNFSWNYLHEQNIGDDILPEEEIKLHVIKFSDPNLLHIELRSEYLEKDWGNGLERIEYFPFSGAEKEIQHYNYLKGY